MDGSGTVVTSSSVNRPGELVKVTEAIPGSEIERKEVAPVVPSVLGLPKAVPRRLVASRRLGG